MDHLKDVLRSVRVEINNIGNITIYSKALNSTTRKAWNSGKNACAKTQGNKFKSKKIVIESVKNLGEVHIDTINLKFMLKGVYQVIMISQQLEVTGRQYQ